MTSTFSQIEFFCIHWLLHRFKVVQYAPMTREVGTGFEELSRPLYKQ